MISSQLNQADSDLFVGGFENDSGLRWTQWKTGGYQLRHCVWWVLVP